MYYVGVLSTHLELRFRLNHLHWDGTIVLDQDSTVLGKGGTGDDNVSGLLSDLTSGQQVRKGESDGEE